MTQTRDDAEPEHGAQPRDEVQPGQDQGVVLVTGASSGPGAAVAARLAGEDIWRWPERGVVTGCKGSPSRINTGTIWIKTHHVYDAELPFAGYKKSSHGRDVADEAIASYTETKAVTIEL